MNRPTVFVIDDDASVRDALVWLLESVHLTVLPFTNAESFLKQFNPEQPGCIVLDMRMPGISGLSLLDKLSAFPSKPQVILVTAYGTVSTTVRAMRAGAIYVLEKPYDDQELIDIIQEALQRDASLRELSTKRREFGELLKRLTPREHEVLSLMMAGKANKVMAQMLKVTVKNIEFHRANVFEKLESDTLAELVHKVIMHGSVHHKHPAI